MVLGLIYTLVSFFDTSWDHNWISILVRFSIECGQMFASVLESNINPEPMLNFDRIFELFSGVPPSPGNHKVTGFEGPGEG